MRGAYMHGYAQYDQLMADAVFIGALNAAKVRASM